MNQELLTWIGYIASIITATSMALNSVVKFRVVNMIGAAIFATYGFLIGALPVGALNGFIVLVDIYYLFQIFGKKEQFKTLEIRNDNRYLLEFLKYHHAEIQKFFPGFEYKPQLNTISFFVLRNMAVSGVFLAHKEADNKLVVGLDYVIPEYRDLKNGIYIYEKLKDFFLKENFESIETKGYSKANRKYLKRMGFNEIQNDFFERKIVK